MRNNKCLKKVAVLIFASILCILLIVGIFEKQQNTDTPIAENGILDLSHWNFDDNGKIPLNGEWTFYPNQLLSPSELTDASSLKSYALKVPGCWKNAELNRQMADRGVGTYQLIIKTDGCTPMYGIKITNIRSSCKIFANGNEIAIVGNPTPQLSENDTTNILPVTAFFPSNDKTINLVVQVANQDYYNGGIIQSIFLGSQKNIFSYDSLLKVSACIGLSLLLIFGFSYVFVYFFNKRNKHFLFFGLVCITYSFVRATDGEKILNFIIYFIPFMHILRAKNVAICLSIIFMGLFIRELGKNFIPLSVLKSLIFILSFMILSFFVVPTQYIYILEIILGFCDVFSYLTIGAFVLKAICAKQYGSIGRKGALILLAGIFILVMSFLGAFLYFSSMIHVYISTTFVLLVALSVASFLFVYQYTRTYDSMKTLNQKLIRADQEKNEFLLQTSNEFRTPLHSIIGIARSTIENGHEPIRQKQNMILISSIAARLSSLVNDIIDFQSLQDDTLRLTIRNFDLNGTIQAVIDVLVYMKKEEQIQLLNSVTPSHFYVYADENRLHQILINVIGNALKNTEKGFIKIAAESVGDKILISIEDTGAGICEEKQKILFIPASGQPDFGNSTEVSGGMGLKISKMLALHMHGDLYLQKSIPGSVFIIEIPRMAVSSVNNIVESCGKSEESRLIEPSGKTAGENQRFGSGTHKLLVVDDEVENIKTMQEVFHSGGYSVLKAYSGLQALEVLKNHKDISIVLLDTAMPGMSGYEVSRRIRSEHSLYELPILLFTTRYSQEDIAESFEAGANDFLTKPYDVRELTARVNTLLQMKESAENTVRMETAFLQSQIKPHFLYNALSTIISLCRKDSSKAESLLKDLSNYLRGSLEIDPNNSFFSVKQELLHVESYLNIDKARFGERLNIIYDLEDGAMGVMIPAIVIQPIVENAVRHGVMKRLLGGTIVISAKIENTELVVSISDDGLGMTEEKKKTVLDYSISTGGIGLKNVNKRLVNAYGQGLWIESAEGKGTKITFRVPIASKMQKGAAQND